MTRPRSLQGRLLLLVLALVAAVWGGALALVWRDASAQIDALLDGHLAQAATLLVVQQGNEPGDGDLDLDLPLLQPTAPKVVFQLFRAGRPMARSANAPLAPLAQPMPVPTGFFNVRRDGVDWRVFAAVGREHQLQVFVAERIDVRVALLHGVLRSILWPMLAALPFLVLGIFWSVRRSIAPLRRLGALLAQRMPQDHTPLVLEETPVELQPVLAALNDLLTRAARLLEQARRFTADAAHELRTPIAAIRAQLQVAQGEPDRVARAAALQATLQGCDRAAHLVEQLLTLSRVETEVLPSRAPVDLAVLSRAVLADLAPQSLRRGQQFALEAAEGALVAGEAVLLGVLLRNLADNAIRYSPPGATIRVTVGVTATDVQWRVEDSGPGMAPDDLARVGERFFRVLGTGEVGSGLGWSIVQRIAAVHQATLTLGRSADLGGLCVDVRLVRLTSS